MGPTEEWMPEVHGIHSKILLQTPFLLSLAYLPEAHTVQTILLPQKVSMIFLLPSDSILKSLASRILLDWVATYLSHVIFMVLCQKDDYMSILQMRKLRQRQIETLNSYPQLLGCKTETFAKFCLILAMFFPILLYALLIP